MRYTLTFFSFAIVVFVATGCYTPPQAANNIEQGGIADLDAQEIADAEPPTSIVRQPALLDHKNLKFGREIPDWVILDQAEIERSGAYPNSYVFKFESPRSQNLQAADIWTRNFTAPSQIAASITNRVRAKFSGATAGDLNQIDNYLEQVVETLSEVEISGYTAEADYWVQNRYYDTDGEPIEDAYTVIVLYTMQKNILDGLIQQALDGATQVAELTDTQETVRQRVVDSFADGL